MHNNHPDQESITSSYSREASVYYLEHFRHLQSQGFSQNQAAAHLNLPRTTLQGFKKYESRGGPWASGVFYWESLEGLEMLKRLVLSAHLVFNQTGAAGIRMVMEFFELSGLSPFIANSYGSQQAYAQRIAEQIASFGKAEGLRLGKQLSLKKITAILDETFHPKPCLVAIEPISNFILTELYSEKRRAEDWKRAMESGLEGLSVEVVQVTGDEGTALKAYAQKELGVPHSPDLWHQQSDLTKATYLSLRGRTNRTEDAWQKARKERELLEKQQADYWGNPRPKGRPLDFQSRIEAAQAHEKQQQEHWEAARTQEESVSEARKRLSQVYHLVDLESGEVQSAETVAQKIQACLAPIEAVMKAKQLSAIGNRKVRKVLKVTQQMKATIDWVWSMTAVILQNLKLSPKMEMIFMEQLVPALYFETLAQKANSAEERKYFENKALEFRKRLNSGPFQALIESVQKTLEKAAFQAISFFQRSSSCVEGRNGVLRLRHHQLHIMTEKQLEVLTVLHNYWIKRADGTTAAERFFEKESKDLFQYLLENMSAPPRPAKKRRAA